MSENTLQQRLATLRGEYETGQRAMAALERERTDTRDTLLRIAGAIQVLEELLGAPAHEPVQPAH
jgi:hypothetical protein